MTDTTGRKDDQGKAPLWHLGYVSNALADVARVLDAGGKKYGVENWRKVGDFRNRYASALLRHVVAFLRGEEKDPDDGLPHLAHAVCCALFLMEGPEKESWPPKVGDPAKEPWTPKVGDRVRILSGVESWAPPRFNGLRGTVTDLVPSHNGETRARVDVDPGADAEHKGWYYVRKDLAPA